MEKTLEKIILEITKTSLQTRADLDSFKRKIAKEYKIACPSNNELLLAYHRLTEKGIEQKNREIETLLTKRPVRSLSGIVNVSVLTKPWPCSGRCIFCPAERGMPKSYVSGEPAAERAKALAYQPYLQVQKRLEILQLNGHSVDKVELRIIGGTWSYYPKPYQNWFISRCLQACNEFNKPNSKVYGDPSSVSLRRTGLRKLQKANETARCRIVGITVETRPDFIDIKEIKRMRELGITRVELGVQSIYDDVLKINKRGHKVVATIEATRLLKNAGFKVSYQIMPDLLGSNFKRDVKMFERLFSDPDFKPDLVKIYPLALVQNTRLYDDYKKGNYRPYTKKRLIEVLIKAKQRIPFWCRIERIMRDIPSVKIVEGGARTLNLREFVQKEMKDRRLRCRCIRCREVGAGYDPKEKILLFRQDYEAAGGREIFLSFENKKRTKLYGLLRVRFSQYSESGSRYILPALKDAAIIREVHTYGQMAQINSIRNVVGSPQHRGLGKKLIGEAEKIVEKEFNFKKIAVIASVGTRGYYRKLGYRLSDTYMVKKL